MLRRPRDSSVVEVTAKRRRKPHVPKLDEMLGPLEAEVMEIIWIRGTALVSEVEEVLNKRRTVPLAYKTVLTICTRLSEKGILDHEKEGRAFRYYPTMTQTEFVAAQASKASDALLSRFGDVALASFVDQVAADPEQLVALRNLLNKDEYS
jgi:predicted transcriptional regulator